MDGYEMIKKVRQTDLDVLIILATGKSNLKNVTEGYGAGANNYIKKPYTPGELDAHIKALIDLKNRSEPPSQNKVYAIGKYSFDPQILTLDFNNSEIIKLIALRSYLSKDSSITIRNVRQIGFILEVV